MRSLLISLFVTLFFLPLTHAQTFSKKDLLFDLNYMSSAFESGHPSKIAYKEKFNFGPKIKSVTANLPETLTKIQYESAVREVFMEVKCLHTSYHGWEAKRPQSNDSVKRFPYFVFTDGEKIWINEKVNDSIPSTLNIGDELVSIDGYPIKKLLHVMLNLQPDDGAGQQVGRFIINNHFPKFINKYIPSDSIFTVVTRDDAGTEKTSVIAACLFKPKVEEDKDFILEGNDSYYSVLDNSIGYLRIKTIQSSEQDFYQRVFQSVADSNVKTLILDLRNNPGGNLYSCTKLLTYLLPDTSHFSLTFPKENMLPYMARKNRRKIRLHNVVLRRFRSDSYEKTDEGKVYTQLIIPNDSLGYSGKLFVLTNEITASGASFISSFSRHRRESTIIGQTTAGGEYWLNAAPGRAYPLVTLPKSGLIIQTSTHHIRFDTPAKHYNGIVPDYLLEYNAKTFGHRDLEMEKVMELMHQ